MSEQGQCKVILMKPELVPPVWPDIRPLLEPAIKRSDGRWEREQVYHLLCIGQQQLWLILKNDFPVAAVTTEVCSYPESKALCVHFIGGVGLEGWYSELMKHLNAFAKKSFCQYIETNARHGFWKIFKEDGWDRPSAFYQKEV